MTLDDLIALCDEMAALARAGIPLDRGLREVAFELPGRLGKISGDMANSLARGEDLGTYLRTHAREFPPIFVAVVESGLRTGRLSVALEDLAHSARIQAAFRRSLLSAWIYPLAIIAVAFSLLQFMLAKPIPVMLKAYDDVALSNNPLMNVVRRLSETVDWWWVVPSLAIFLFALSWWLAQRAGLDHAGLRWWMIGANGPFVRLRQSTQLAAFTHLLALMLKHLVPLPEALRLAGEGCGNSQLRREVNEHAAKLERGEIAPRSLRSAPPVLAWLLCQPPPAGELTKALELLSESYTNDAERQSDILNWYGPVVLTAGLGGTVVAAYCLFVAGPWLSVLYAYIEQALA